MIIFFKINGKILDATKYKDQNNKNKLQWPIFFVCECEYWFMNHEEDVLLVFLFL